MDDDRHSKATPPAAADVTRPSVAKRFWLEHGARNIELRVGTLVIGRSSASQIALDDALVSRRHAQLTVTPDSVVVQDFGSVNGVYVNQKRISGPEQLKEGDQLQVGTQVMVLRSVLDPARARGGPRVSAETLRGVDVSGGSGRPLSTMLTETEATFSAHTLDLLGGVAEKVLALGRGEEAEKVLSMTLTNLLSDVRTRGGGAQPHVYEKAVHYAVKLAEVTGKGRWIDYAIDLYAGLKRPLPSEVVDQLYSVLRKVDVVNLPGLRAYVAELRAVQQSFGPAERFVLQRIEGLERVASLK
ncbi:MAG TPA: FHA domain-containing protein [Polyangiaceae bacterium]|nr:FHA domain-containing protein [Polyangiaceae bacterium]